MMRLCGQSVRTTSRLWLSAVRSIRALAVFCIPDVRADCSRPSGECQCSRTAAAERKAGALGLGPCRPVRQYLENLPGIEALLGSPPEPRLEEIPMRCEK